MIYNYLISDYVNQERYKNYSAERKKEDLKKTYFDIVKLSKDSPSYIIKPTEEAQAFAIQLKEGSLTLQETLEQLQNGGLSSAFSYKEVHCDQPNVLSVQIDTSDHSKLPDDFKMEINHLAKPQINVGNYTYRDSHRLEAGTYVIQMDLEDQIFEFSFDIPSKLSNEQILRGISRRLNSSDADISATTSYDKDHEKIRLSIKTNNTGMIDGTNPLSIKDISYPSGSRGLVELYDLNHIEQNASNSSFLINDEEKSTIANEFTLNNSLHLTMHQTTSEPLTVSFLSNSDRIMTEMEQLQETYNGLVNLSYHPSSDPNKFATHMLNDLKNLFSIAKNELAQCGITFNADGYMEVAEDIAQPAAAAGKFEKIFGQDNQMASQAIKQSKMFTLDPMRYIEDKIIVNYPNPRKEHFANPYMTSIYSGMLFNNYC